MKLTNNNTLAHAARALLLAAAAVAGYLGYASATSTPIAGCGDGSSCANVLAGGWSKIFGIPVAFAGLGAYLLLAGLAGKVADGSRGAPAKLGLMLMVVIPAVAVWFVVLQAFVIGAFCPWCCAAHLLAVLGVTALVFARSAGSKAAPATAPRGGSLAAVCSVSMLAVAGFIAASGLSPKEDAGVAEADLENRLERRPSVPCLPLGPTPEQHEGDALVMHDGEVSVWPEELPGIGNPESEKVVVLLADFTCEHCRSLHAMLDEVAQVYGDQLGIVVLPAARDENAKLIQRVALALHRENPDLYRALSASIGSGEVEPTPSAVSDEATRLVGAERLTAALQTHREWIDAQLASTAKLRSLNKEKAGRSTLPQLMIEEKVIFGAHPSPGYYVDLFQSRLAVHQVALIDTVVGAGSSEDRPKLEFKSNKIPIGEVRAGETVNVSVPYENTGEGPLVFRWIKTPPGVGVIDLPSGEIEPGGKGELTFNVRVPSETGRIERKLVVHSNDQFAGTTLDILAYVAPDPLKGAKNPWDG